MIVASTIVPCRISRPRSSSIVDTSANNAWLKFMLLQPRAEIQDCRLLRDPRRCQIEAGKAAQGLAVIERILHRSVGQPIPLLQEVNPPASAPARSAAGRARPSGKAVTGVPTSPFLAQPAPSRPKTYRAASASFCRRIPPCEKLP